MAIDVRDNIEFSARPESKQEATVRADSDNSDRRSSGVALQRFVGLLFPSISFIISCHH
jgi:hypothetical protein